jgi:hypothetical protein
VFAKAKDDAKEWSVGEGMEIVVEFKRRMEVCFGEAKALRNRERERVDSPCGDHSSAIAFAQLKTRCAIRGLVWSKRRSGGGATESHDLPNAEKR